MMIDWLYQSTIDVSILLVVIMFIRNPVRRIFGAHVSYWLWSLPLLSLFISDKFNRPDIITRYLKIPESSDLIAIYSGPIQASESQIQVIGIIWLLGFLVWSLIKLSQAYHFNSLLNQHSKLVLNCDYISEALLQKFNFNIRLKVSSAVEGPLITGLFKPTIYLPQNVSQHYSEAERQLILEHELTHAKRLDLWTQLLAEMFKALFWFNPLVHIAWTKFQLDQELACDHQVLKNTDFNKRKAYGETLKKGLSALLTPNSLTFFNHKHERFIMLRKHKRNFFISITGLILIAFIGYLVLTKTDVSFGEKDIKTHGGIVSYNFKNIPLDAVAVLVSDATTGVIELDGLELLQGIMVNVEAEKVHAFDFFDALLKDNDLKVNRQGNTWSFSKL